MKKLFSFLNKMPYWYVLVMPVMLVGFGIISNQLVLISNHDKFPVMGNSKKLQEFMHPSIDDEQRINLFNLISVRTSIIVNKTIVDSQPDPDGMIDDIHCVMSKSSHLKILSDIIDMQQYTESVGDILITFGGWLLNFAPLVWLTLVIRKLISA